MLTTRQPFVLHPDKSRIPKLFRDTSSLLPITLLAYPLLVRDAVESDRKHDDLCLGAIRV